jgi:DNA mismatch repair ATPase MutS
MTLSIHDAVALLRAARRWLHPDEEDTHELAERMDAAVAQYEADMVQHRKEFVRDVKDLDRHLAAHRAWKGDNR